MPIVTVQGKTLTCENGANLRKVLLRHDINLHNGQQSTVNSQQSTEVGWVIFSFQPTAS